MIKVWRCRLKEYAWRALLLVVMEMYDRFETFTVAIIKINRCIHKIKAEVMAQFDLKSQHVSCLYYLLDANGLTATELCEICAEDKSAISRAIDYLEKRGLIYCDSAAKKRYKALLTLTDEGRMIAKIVDDKIKEVLAQSAAGLSKEEHESFYKSLLTIAANLQRICGDEE